MLGQYFLVEYKGGGNDKFRGSPANWLAASRRLPIGLAGAGRRRRPAAKIFPSAPDDERDFELALDLFEERGYSLTALSAAPSRTSVKLAARATANSRILRFPFPPRKRDRRLDA
jgi:hypothetical protein